ncbi:YadA-like family protein [Stenotrophomonas sp. SORGH_AS_0321]|uniref:beta strand repeat-containing protein n=1 Tax=Stenotrophomonas sp. SORGH_AS_0321 TaxID=3041787 RepID=UPI00286CDA13|nr:YadA-like family protein [Stenotrophomonas sp. SORGH_AS_0321]
MAAGTAGTDAVNLNQLAPVVAGLGGGASINPTTGAVTGPSYNIGGAARTNLGDALTNLDGRTTANNAAIGDLADQLAGSGLVDDEGNAIAAVTYGRNADGSTNYSRVTFGDASGSAPVQLKNVAAGTDGTDAVNLDQMNTAIASVAPAENPYFAGNGPTANPARATSLNSVALGAGSLANGANTVSVGNSDTGLRRRITNVGDGTARTDAATVGQLNDLVGGATLSTQQALDDVNTKISSLSSVGTMAAVDDAYVKVDAPAGSESAVVGADTYGVAIGVGATATGSLSAAFGAASEATGTQALALGADAKATADGTLAMGSSQASAVNAVALGNGTVASGNNAVASGFNANATGTNAVAFGNTSQARSENAVAIGSTASVAAAATNAVALGRGASVAAAGVGSVALGAGSVADRGNAVSVGSATQGRQIINVAAGTADNDAVNLSQLRTYVADNGGNPLAVAYADDDKDTVNLAGADGTTIRNVAAGAVNATSTDAINGAQLHANATSVAAGLGGGSTVAADGTVTAPSYNVGGAAHTNVGDALTNLDGRTNANNTAIGDLADQLAGSGLVDDDGDTLAAVTYDKNGDGTPNRASVTLGEAGTAVRVSNVAAGAVNATSTDAINGAQLHANATSVAAGLGGGSTVAADGTVTAPSYNVGGAAHTNVGDALTNLDGRTNANNTAIGDLADQLAGSGLVDDDGDTLAAVTYDKNGDGTPNRASVTLGEAGTAVRVSNVAAGAVNATSTDAINGAQLHANATSVAAGLGGGSTVAADGTVTAPSYNVGGAAHTNVGDALTNLDGRTNANNTAIGDLADQLAGSGLVDDDGDTLAAVTYDKNADGTPNRASVTLGEAGTAVRVSNVAAGAVNATSTDAINGAQLHANATSVAAGLGGGSTVAADGTVTAPSYNVGGAAHTNVGDALTNLDGRTNANNTAIGDLADQLAGSGLVDDDGDTLAAVTYDKNADGTPNFGSVTLGNGGGAVRLRNVANGVDATDAVNVSQLTAATANPFFAGRGAGTAATATGLGSVALGINSVANQANTVSLGNATLVRRITNMADGQARTDGATVGQVNDLVSGVESSTAGALADVNNRISALSSAGTMAAVDDTYVKVDAPAGSDAAEVAANSYGVAVGVGSKATGSMSAAIGASSEASGTQALALGADSKATADGALAMGVAQASGTNAVALGNGTVAAGSNAVASGFNANATGTNAVALGNTSQALSDNAIAIGATANVAAAATNSVAFGRGASVTAAGVNSVALGAGSLADRTNVVSVGTSTQQRQIINVAQGTADTDAVNYGQLRSYVADNGGGGGANPLAVAYADAGKGALNLEGADGTTISNVKAGDVSATSTDAINGSQLHGTAESVAAAIGGGSVVNADGTVSAPTFTIGGDSYSSIGDTFNAVDTSLTDLDGRVTGNSTSITNINQQLQDLNAGSAGIVTFDEPNGTVNVASALGGNTVNLAGTDGARKLVGVADGEVAAGSNDAVNGSQLHGTAESVAAAIGGGSVVNADGTVSAPTFTIGGDSYSSIGDTFNAVDTSLTDLDGRVTGNSTSITNINQQLQDLNAGSAGIVTFDEPTSTVNVASALGGNTVNLAGTDGARKLVGVADGEVAAGSNDAVNGSQLSETNDRVASTESSIVNIDGRLTTTEGNVTNLSTVVNNLSNGTAGLVTIDPTTSNVQVAAAQGGTVVDVTGTDGARRLSGVANGTDDHDVVTIAQLRAAGAIDPVSGQTLSVLTYDGVDLARATLGGTHGTVIGNLANGLIGAGSMEAVNGGQLFQMNANWEAKWTALDGRVGVIEAGNGGGNGGGSGGGGSGIVAPGAGEGSVEIGGGKADGDRSVAIGDGSSATGSDSVAIGSGSVAAGDREVSVGAPGAERRITNVAAGVERTDAVNLGQMNDRFEQEREWSNSRFQAVDKRIDRMGAISAAYAGMAINTAGLSGDNRLGAGIGSQNGRSALAVGYQRILGEKKNVSVSLGGAFSGSDQSVSAGAGFSW